MRTALICHHDSRLDLEGLSRWLDSFSELAGIVVLQERPGRVLKRIRREIGRVGPLRFLDVLAMRAYSRARLARPFARYQNAQIKSLTHRFLTYEPPRILLTPSPNSEEARAFLKDLAPDLIIARCKTLLAERIFTIPTLGTFVLHPGICPEYRNAHGCFWALANDDLDKVGLTLLKIDTGIDTGPVFGYFTYSYDESTESHLVIQQRVLFENLDAIRQRLLEIESGTATPIDVSGRHSSVWGQPWLTRYIHWRRAATSRAT